MSRKKATDKRVFSIPIVSLVLVLMAACLTSSTDAGPGKASLELVLAVDASDSMTRAEMLLQRRGYAAALRSVDIAEAIAVRGGLALIYIEWAGPHSQKIVVPWTILSDGEDAVRFADALAAAPLNPGFGSPPWERGTSISHALLFAAGTFRTGSGANRIIDISGNGPNNSGDLLSTARDRVIAESITINGLPVIVRAGASNVSLGVYYKDCVIGGPGAFAISVDDPSLFGIAIRRKLVLEIAGQPARLIHADYPSANHPATDLGDAISKAPALCMRRS